MKLSKFFLLVFISFFFSLSIAEAMESDPQDEKSHKKMKRSKEPPTKSQPPRRNADRKAKNAKTKKSSHAVKEKVIGPVDNRIEITNPKSYSYPWSIHGRVEMLFKSKNKKNDLVCSGTGTVVGKRFVLTAGHNLFVRNDTLDDKEHRKSYDPTPYKVSFYPGMSREEPRIKAAVKKLEVTQEWSNINIPSTTADKYDIGLLVLHDEIADITGSYSGFIPNNDFFKKFTLHITGYPGDLPKGKNGKPDPYISSKVMYTDSGVSHNQDDSYMYYNISTYCGNSGGSTWVLSSNSNDFNNLNPNDNFYYVGVHTTGMTDVNRGIRLTQELSDRIRNWMDANQ